MSCVVQYSLCVMSRFQHVLCREIGMTDVKICVCLLCRFMHILCEFQSKRARCASPGSLRSLWSVQCLTRKTFLMLHVQNISKHMLGLDICIYIYMYIYMYIYIYMYTHMCSLSLYIYIYTCIYIYIGIACITLIVVFD